MNTTTLDTLIDTLYRHRAAHALPDPINVGFDLIQPGIDTQVALADTVAALLAWGHSLDQVTVTGWRHRADRVHLTILGHMVGGVPVRVYGGTPYTENLTMALDETVPLTLDELGGLLADTPAGAA
jgi:hypothetical protein